MDRDEQNKESVDSADSKKGRVLEHIANFFRTIEGVTFTVTILMLIAVSILFVQSRSTSANNREILANIQDCIDGTGPCGASNDAQLKAVYQFIIASNFCAITEDAADLDAFSKCIFETAPTVKVPEK